MSEMQWLLWLLSRTACADVNDAIQEVTSVKYMTSEQHKDLSKTRTERGLKDTRATLKVPGSQEPFQ